MLDYAVQWSLIIKNILSRNKLSQFIYSYIHIKYALLVRTPVTKNAFRGSLGVCYNETPLYSSCVLDVHHIPIGLAVKLCSILLVC